MNPKTILLRINNLLNMPKSKSSLVSPLELLDLQVLKSSFKFVPPDEEEEVKINTEELFRDYDIHIDYSINSHDDNVVLIFMKCGVNFEQDNPKIGYELFTEMVNAFNISEVKKVMKEAEYKRLVVYSGLSMAINNIRNSFYQLTIQGPFKDYILPAIDVQALINMKKGKPKKKKVIKKKRKITIPKNAN